MGRTSLQPRSGANTVSEGGRETRRQRTGVRRRKKERRLASPLLQANNEDLKQDQERRAGRPLGFREALRRAL